MGFGLCKTVLMAQRALELDNSSLKNRQLRINLASDNKTFGLMFYDLLIPQPYPIKCLLSPK